MRSIVINRPVLHRSALELAVPRSVTLLRAVSTDPAIRTEMQKVGFGPADAQQGWSLVLRACSAPQPSTRFTSDAGRGRSTAGVGARAIAGP